MKAKIIGPASELGDIGDGLKFFGGKVVLNREYGDELPDLTADEVRTLRGNQYVALEGDNGESPSYAEAQDAARDSAGSDVIKARLTELGVKYDGRSGKDKLQAQLDKAEADKAKADEKADKAQADADKAKEDADGPLYKGDDKAGKAAAAAASEEA